MESRDASHRGEEGLSWLLWTASLPIVAVPRVKRSNGAGRLEIDDVHECRAGGQFNFDLDPVSGSQRQDMSGS